MTDTDEPDAGPAPRRLTVGNVIKRVPYRYRKRLFRAGFVLSVLAIVGVMGFPIYWMLNNSFQTTTSITGSLTLLPTTFTLDHYEAILGSSDIRRYIVNSIKVTAGTVVLSVSISLATGYGLSSFDYTGKTFFARFIFVGYMFSPIVVALPLFLLFRMLGLLNTHIGLILAITTITLPFNIWLMWKYFKTIPASMEESAWVAGASRWRAFVEVVVPQVSPAIVATALFAFALAWNDFTFAKILVPSNDVTTFAPGVIQVVKTNYTTAYGELMAAGTVMALPPILFAYFLQSYLLKGFELRN